MLWSLGSSFQEHVNTKSSKGIYLNKIPLTDSTYLLEWGNQEFKRIFPDTFYTQSYEPYWEWENKYAIGLHRACGSPCWYELILPLNPKDSVMTISSPLVHDFKNNLVVYIETDSSIAVTNFLNKKKLSINLTPHCYTAFLDDCIDSIYFKNKDLFISWFVNEKDKNGNEKKRKAISIKDLI